MEKILCFLLGHKKIHVGRLQKTKNGIKESEKIICFRCHKEFNNLIK